MDDKAREGIKKLCDYHHERVLKATDPKEISEAMRDYQIAMDLLLKYDSMVDTHDENIEKILNAQANDENRREDELKKEERRFQFEKKKFAIEFWKDIGKTAVLVLINVVIVVMVFLFDGRGVIFTSSAGKTVTSSVVRKLFDWMKI